MALVMLREQQLAVPTLLPAECGEALEDLLALEQLAPHPRRHRQRERLETAGGRREMHAQQPVELAQRLLVEHDGVDPGQPAALFEAVPHRVRGEARIVPAAGEALLLGGSEQRPVPEQDRRAVVVVSGDSEDVHRQPALEK
jgi:hypothetical protein